MRIKIIGDNNCARATRHLLRLAGFAVTEFLPADALAGGPLAGYSITIDLAPALHTPDARLGPPIKTVDRDGQAYLRPDSPTQHHASASEEAPPLHRDASSPAFVRQTEWRTSAGEPALPTAALPTSTLSTADLPSSPSLTTNLPASPPRTAGLPAVAPANFQSGGGIHFDSVESALEAAVLRHVTQLAAAPVIVDRPGGVVHSDRELRIVAPNTGDAKTDEAAAVAIEFGVLRGLLDLSAPVSPEATAAKFAEAATNSRSVGGRKKWWPFGIVLFAAALGVLRARTAAAPALADGGKTHRLSLGEPQDKKPVLLKAAPLLRADVFAGFAEPEPQGQFTTGQGLKITDGINFLVVDPCKAQAKLYASINQTVNTQLVAGTVSKKVYVCSIHVVAAAATNVAVVEGTGSVCATSTAGVSGFGGATAATGWNFAPNGGIALGNGDSSLGAEGTSGDNLCLFNSGSGQVSGGISYVVE